MMTAAKKLEKSRNSYNEILYRIRLVEDAIGLYYFYGTGFNQRQRDDPEGIDFRPEDTARCIAVQYAFLQIAAILDQTGEYSLHMNNFRISAKRFQQLFPVLQGSELTEIVANTNAVLIKHKKTLNTIFKVRGSRIAHLGDLTHKIADNENDEYIYFKLQNHIPSSFRFKRITEFCRDLNDVLQLLWS